MCIIVNMCVCVFVCGVKWVGGRSVECVCVEDSLVITVTGYNSAYVTESTFIQEKHYYYQETSFYSGVNTSTVHH